MGFSAVDSIFHVYCWLDDRAEGPKDNRHYFVWQYIQDSFTPSLNFLFPIRQKHSITTAMFTKCGQYILTGNRHGKFAIWGLRKTENTLRCEGNIGYQITHTE